MKIIETTELEHLMSEYTLRTAWTNVHGTTSKSVVWLSKCGRGSGQIMIVAEDLLAVAKALEEFHEVVRQRIDWSIERATEVE